MIMYKRNIRNRLLSLRLLFVLLLTISYLAFKSHNYNLSYFIVVVMIFTSIIVVTDFIIFIDSFHISKYYFFGLFRVKFNFNKLEKVQIISNGVNFGEDDEINYSDETDTGIGCLFTIFQFFYTPKVAKKEFFIERNSENIDLKKRIKILLDETEYNCLKALMK
jgi:hypothetical protein